MPMEAKGDTIVLSPIRRFRAKRWQDYTGIGEGIVAAHLRDRKKEKADEDVCS